MISSREQHLGEHRTGTEGELGGALVEDVGAGDVGRQEVRRELDTPECATKRAGQGAGQHGLADARHVLDEDVAVAQDGDKQELSGLPLADHHALNLAVQPLGRRGDGFNVCCLHGSHRCTCTLSICHWPR